MKCGECQHFAPDVMVTGVTGLCRKIGLDKGVGNPAVLICSGTWAALLVDESFGCALFEEKRV